MTNSGGGVGSGIVTFCILARSFPLPLTLKPPALSCLQDRFRLEGRQVMFPAAFSDRTPGAAQLRRQLAIWQGAQQYVGGRALKGGILRATRRLATLEWVRRRRRPNSASFIVPSSLIVTRAVDKPSAQGVPAKMAAASKWCLGSFLEFTVSPCGSTCVLSYVHPGWVGGLFRPPARLLAGNGVW